MAWLVRALPRRRRRAPQGRAGRDHLQRLMPADALRIRGRHNAANALAALALATAIGCPLAPMLHGLREYRGEPHRVEHVASVDGVDAFDDSKGTNVGATVAALDGLGADKRAGQAGRHPRRRRQGPGLRAAGRAGGAPRARGGARSAATRRAIEAALAAHRRADRSATTRSKPRRAGAFEQARAGRRGAAEPGLRQPRHVPQLRAPRRGVRRRGAARSRHEQGQRRRCEGACRVQLDGRHGASRASWRGAAHGAPPAPAAPRAGRRRRRRGDAGARLGQRRRGQPARLLGFDQALVCGRRRPARARPGDGLFSASVALPDNPSSPATRRRYFLTRHLLSHRHRRRSRRWSRCRCRSRLWEKLRALDLRRLAAAAGRRAAAVRRQGRQRRAALDPARPHELPAVASWPSWRSRCTPPATWCGKHGREGELRPRRAADGDRARASSACCCWPSPTWAPSW